MISRSSIDRIFEAAHIDEVVSDFVPLKKAGSNFKGLSPWANEKTPSFFVSPAKGIFKDFSSGKGGNVVSFLMELENMTYPEALRYLANKYQIEIEETEVSPLEAEEVSHRESLALINQFAFEHFEKNLWETDEGKSIGLSYFRERGYTDPTIKTFGLGYSFDQSDAFLKAAEEAGYKKDVLQELGLSKEGNYGAYDFFRGRVIFPIRNISGRPIAFAGRTLKSDNKVKYLNSPETELYDKSNTLYGIYEAKRSMIKEDLCCLVEGYTDVISLHQAGIEYAVASSGTALTSRQVKLIKRYTQNVLLLYDGDSAGVKASLRAIDLILEEGLNVKVALFPEGHDPDSYSRSVSQSELERYLKEESLDFSDFMLKVLLDGEENDPLKKANATKQVVQSLALIQDHITRSVYLSKVSKQLNIQEQALYNEMNKYLRSKQFRNSRSTTEPTTAPLLPEEPLEEPGKIAADPSLHEKEVTRMLLKYAIHEIDVEIENEEGEKESLQVSVGEFVLHDLFSDNIEFHSPIYSKILNSFKDRFESDGGFPSHDEFVRNPDPTLSQIVAEIISSPYELSLNWEEQHKIYTTKEEENLKRAIEDPLMRLKLTRIKEMMRGIDDKLKKYKDDEELNTLLKEKIKLDRMKSQVSDFFGIAII